MKNSNSTFLPIRGLRYHVRTWGDADKPQLYFLHGWMDLSASFQFVVDALQHEWHVIAPDFRGFGLTEWPQDGYWFPDYFADVEAILDHYSPQAPVILIGHSMGGNVASLYAGIRPARIKALVNLEGFGLPPTKPADALARYAQWLDEIRDGVGFRSYQSAGEYAQRLRNDNPRLTEARALFLATCATRTAEDGSVKLRGDPRHKRRHATLYRVEEALAIWRNVTAPVLWVGANDSWIMKNHRKHPEDYAARKQAFAQLEEIIMADCGHMMHIERPHETAALIEQFALHFR